MSVMEWNQNLFKEVNYEEGVEDGIRIGTERGKEEGRQEGRQELNLLVQKLLQENRMEDLRRQTEDSDYQRQLLEEYGLLETTV